MESGKKEREIKVEGEEKGGEEEGGELRRRRG